MNNNTEKYELQLLYISQVASIIFIIISLIAIFLTHHDIKVLKHEKTLITDVIFDMIKKELIKMEVLKTDAKWYGVTYKEDKEEVVNAINEMVRTKKYNKNLWG